MFQHPWNHPWKCWVVREFLVFPCQYFLATSSYPIPIHDSNWIIMLCLRYAYLYSSQSVLSKSWEGQEVLELQLKQYIVSNVAMTSICFGPVLIQDICINLWIFLKYVLIFSLNDDGFAPLDVAVMLGSFPIIKMLLLYGAHESTKCEWVVLII